MATDLKFHHIIVLVALLVSLVGTLLVLEKISGAGTSITSATTIGEEDIPEKLPTLDDQIEIRIENQTTEE